MEIRYRITLQELNVFSGLVSEGRQSLFPMTEFSEEELREAVKGLERKGYIEQNDKEILLDQVMTKMVQRMLASKKKELEKDGMKMYLYEDQKITVLQIKESQTAKHYLLIPFPNMESLKNSDYGYLIRS